MFKQIAQYPNLHIIQHPLIQYKLSIMRNKETSNILFRQALHEIALLLIYEATHSIKLKEKIIETPIASTVGYEIPEVVIVSILRSGLGMAESAQKLIPEASQGHIGMYRDPQTKVPVDYLCQIPEVRDQRFLVVDPMLATGGSAINTVKKLLECNVKSEQITFVGIISAPEGVEAFYKAYPDIPVFVASLDERLNDNKYIIPGLGDCGNRLFGTE